MFYFALSLYVAANIFALVIAVKASSGANNFPDRSAREGIGAIELMPLAGTIFATVVGSNVETLTNMSSSSVLNRFVTSPC
jgi:hypothetical protein